MKLLDLFFPRKCPVCARPIPFGCECCDCHSLQTLRVPLPFCEHCGETKAHCICSHPDEIVLPHFAAPFYYAGQVRDDLLALKFCGARDLARRRARDMALCFAERFADVEPDVVTAVPMTKKARRARGFNQSELLAKRIAAQLLLEFAPLLQKTRETEKQHTLGQQARRENLKQAFALLEQADVRGKTVLLVDDIKTTGATLHECVCVLQKNGAAAVYCLCCAMTDYEPDAIKPV